MTFVEPRSFVLAADRHFAPLRETVHRDLRRRFRHGPDVQEAALDAIAARQPRDVLEVAAGTGEFASRIRQRTQAEVLAADPSPPLVTQARMRGVPAVVADVRALPLRTALLDCVFARHARWPLRLLDQVLQEVARVLRAGGALITIAGSVRRDAHELDALLGAAPRRSKAGVTAENGADVLARHFEQVDAVPLDYEMRFPDGSQLATYLAALPTRRHLADRAAGVDGPVRLTYGLRLFVAAVPRGQERPSIG